MSSPLRLFLLSLTVIVTSCGSYRQNIMFTAGENDALKQQVSEAERNYVIQKNDLLKLKVFTQGGELIIDPELKLLKEVNPQTMNLRPDPDYLINIHGIGKFPKIGEMKLEGLTLRQAEAVLQEEYEKYYTNSFVILEYVNKRVVVLGAPGGKVIPLVNDNVTLVEVLALAEGIDNNAKAHNIRVIRGEELFVADLSTFDGYKKSNMIMQPGDIVYVEPIRRPLSEGVRDYGPFVSIVTSLTTLIVVLFSVN